MTNHFKRAIEAVEANFREAIGWGSQLHEMDDLQGEWVDSAIPAYTHELYEMLSEPDFVGQVDDEGLLDPDKKHDIEHVITVACYEQLSERASELVQELREAVEGLEDVDYHEREDGRYVVARDVDAERAEEIDGADIWAVVDTPEKAVLMLQGQRPVYEVSHDSSFPNADRLWKVRDTANHRNLGWYRSERTAHEAIGQALGVSA